METRIGQQLGKYRLISLLGQGGSAKVYLGQHIHLKSLAAIKILYTHTTGDDAEAFLREGQIIAALTHTNILRVLDCDIDSDLFYLVMEYAPNGTLRQRHPKGSILPTTIVLPYVRQIASALQYAHNQRLIHRDVKPENMLIGANSSILLSDFGIATIASDTASQSSQDIVGTVSYMAPEQIQGHPRLASDQYSLGVVIYEWLCGTKPFTGSFTEVAMKHMLMSPPSLREKNPRVSEKVEQVVMCALAKDANNRFHSIQDFALALEQASASDAETDSHFAFSQKAPDDLTDKKSVMETKVSPPASSQEVQNELPGEKSIVKAEASLPASSREVQDETLTVPQPPHEQPSIHFSREESFPPPLPLFSPGFTLETREEARESLLLPPEQTKAFSESVLPKNRRKDFFVSYSRVDRERAMWIAACLQEAGYSVLLPPVDFRTGFIFRNEMQKAFSQAKRMLVAFSPAYLAALQSRSSGFNVFKRAIMQKKEHLLSVCVHDHDSMLEKLSGVANSIDLTGGNERMARAVLLAYIRGEGIELPATTAAQGQIPLLSMAETQIIYSDVFGNTARAEIATKTSALQLLKSEPVREQETVVGPPSLKGIEVFFSYSHKDEKWRLKLETHLSTLKRQRVITGWHDGEIRAGDAWEEEIEAHLSSAHIILLLVSPDFIDSNYCYEKEMLQAMRRHKAGEAHVVPIILRPAHWERTPFGKLQALPPGAKPLTLWGDEDEAFVHVAKSIQKIVDSWSGNASSSSSPDPTLQGTEDAARAKLSEVIDRSGD